jgi:CRISPR-associated protein (TIGR02584 family)
MSEPTPLAPHQYPRRILLALAAKSPQIVTETLYALAQLTDPPWLATEVHLITTLYGQDYIKAAFGDDPAHNKFHQLSHDYGFPCPQFASHHIHLIRDAKGQPLNDILNAQDNYAAANSITQLVRHFTQDPDTSLHVSLSGGRRTMTYYIGYALSLFGRDQDRLSHVVVDVDYLFNDEFYYPPPKPLWVIRKDESGFDASKVTVYLADIPFVRLRAGLPTDLLQGNASFSDTIHAAQQRFAPLNLTLDYRQATLSCHGIPVKMSPAELSFYAWFTHRQLHQQSSIYWRSTENPSLAEQYQQHYLALHGKRGKYAQITNSLANGMTREWFDERKSKTNKALRQALGDTTAQPYLLHNHGHRPHTTCCLNLEAQAIQLKHPPDNITSLSCMTS